MVAGVRFEVRLDMFNALDQVQYTGVNNTANFASLTDPTITNLPHDASGYLVRTNGFGSVTILGGTFIAVGSPRTTPSSKL